MEGKGATPRAPARTREERGRRFGTTRFKRGSLAARHGHFHLGGAGAMARPPHRSPRAAIRALQERSMRPTLTAAALALASTAFSGAATAQYGSAPSSAPQTPAAQGSTPAAAPAKPAMCGADVSSGARPALVAMQAALATKDKAKIAAAD